MISASSLAGRVALGDDDRLELFKTPDHRVVFIQDHLVIKLFYGLPDEVIVHKDPGDLIDVPPDPDLHLPAVAVELGTLALVVEETMTGIKTALL